MKLTYFLVFILVASCSSVVVGNNDENTSAPASINFGTGWLVSPGFIVTNNHVVAQHDRAVIIRTDKSEYNTRVLVRDVANDIALLEIVDDISFPAALPIASKSPSIGEQVFTIGYPHPDVMGSNPKLSVGIINARTGLANDPRLYQISTPLQAGNSGGPLINMQGEVVAIVTSKLNAMKMFKWTGDIPQNVNYAVKINYLRTLIELSSDGIKPIYILPAKQNNLVSLNRTIQDSIVIIKSGVVAAKVNIPIVHASSLREKNDRTAMLPETTVLQKKEYKVAIFTYMTRGRYAQSEELDSTEVYSKNTAMMIKSYLEKDKVSAFKVTYNLHGKDSAQSYYQVYNKDKALELCHRLDVDYLFSVKNDYGIISNYHEEFDLIIKDCAKNSEFARLYYIETKTHDKFNYEIDIRASLRKFLNSYHDQL